MTPRDPRETLSALKSLGYSEYRLAQLLTEAGTPVSQSTLNRIATSETEDASFRVWRALHGLYEKLSRDKGSRKRLTGAYEKNGHA